MSSAISRIVSSTGVPVLEDVLDCICMRESSIELTS